MNKIVKLGCIALLTTVLLAGCAGQSNNSKANSSSKSKSEKLAKESSKKKAESKHKASESEKKASKASAEAESESKVSEAQSSSEQSMASDQQQAQQASSEQTVSYGDLPPFDGTLSDFVNKYGVTPVVYKVQHYGMSVDEALKSTPDELQTSGEIQTEAGY